MWRRLFPKRETTVSATAEWLEDECQVAVVGEASYQDALRRICGSRRWEDVRCEVTAALVPEPDNKYDPNAIQVHIDAEIVGYLSRGDAIDYGPMMQRLASQGKDAACKAVIAGRGPGSETEKLGVFLHMCEPE